LHRSSYFIFIRHLIALGTPQLTIFQEEVIVGRVEGSAIPEWHVSGKAVWPTKWWDMYKTKSGQPFPADLMTKGIEIDLLVFKLCTTN
jgi:hypothetical protein